MLRESSMHPLKIGGTYKSVYSYFTNFNRIYQSYFPFQNMLDPRNIPQRQYWGYSLQLLGSRSTLSICRHNQYFHWDPRKINWIKIEKVYRRAAIPLSTDFGGRQVSLRNHFAAAENSRPAHTSVSRKLGAKVHQ